MQQYNKKERKKNKIKQIPLTIKRSKKEKEKKNSKRKLNYLKEKSLRDITQYVKKINVENLSKQSGTLL